MKTEIIIAGVGGQGIKSAGFLIANAAVKQGFFVTVFVSYGAEIRGGIAYSQIIISDSEIGTPFIDNPDILICMDKSSYRRLHSKVKSGGAIFTNASLFKTDSLPHVKIVKVPATAIAEDKCSGVHANMVIAGAMAGATHIFELASLIDSLYELSSGKMDEQFELNKRMLEEGYSYSLARSPMVFSRL